jgi:hypothetical protein
MKVRYACALVAGSMTSLTAYSAPACDQTTIKVLQECIRIVDSLRPDKMSQMRVYASDGSEFTAGQTMWMKGQLREITRDCDAADQADASRRLAEVQDLLSRHRRTS